MRHLGVLQKGGASPDEKRFPKAREYMEALRYSLHEMWRQLAMWNIEAQCAAWAEARRTRIEWRKLTKLVSLSWYINLFE
jgi:hypothetical protein